MNTKFLLGMLFLNGALSGCGAEATPTPTAVVLRTESDPGVMLANVPITIDDAPQGSSGDQGRLSLTLMGFPESQVQVAASCPEGFEAEPPRALQLRQLRDLDGNPRPIEMTLRCRPMMREGVVVVRAQQDAQGVGVPVMVNGVAVGTTDSSGTYLHHFRMAPGERVQVQLMTGALLPTLMPRDPSTSFQVNDRDDIYVMDQSFEVPPPPVVVRPHVHRPPRPEVPSGPEQIRSSGITHRSFP